MQKLAWLVPFLTGSHHTCHVGHNNSLKVMLFQWKLPDLSARAFRRDQFSIAAFFFFSFLSFYFSSSSSSSFSFYVSLHQAFGRIH